eukprot:TRINITY_DN5602_c0_g1_i4.p1 TRINITY_DN5602_c0_g1~~TRINITY_DN5602_c0_g1_i4.p1  ORF type:complete len:910 (+),score=437.53 TRINITY_DN5602_c0_g1_i4:184-2913(+)
MHGADEVNTDANAEVLQSRLAKEEEKLGDAECKVTALQRELKNAEKALDELEMLRDDYEQAVEAQAAAEDKVRSLTEQLEESQKSQNSSDDIREEIQALKGELTVERDRAQQAEESLKQSIATIAELREKLLENTQQGNALQETLAQQQESHTFALSALQKELSVLKEAKEDLERSLKQSAQDKEEAMKASDEDLRTRVEELEKALEQLQGQSVRRNSVETASSFDDDIAAMSLEELREALYEAREAEASKDARIEELEERIEEVEEEGNEHHRQLNQVEATLTERTQELAAAMEKATVAAAELEEYKLLAEQKITGMIEVDDVMTDLRHSSQHPELNQMLMRFEGVVSELKSELAAARGEASKAKAERDILREREADFLSRKQTQQKLEASLSAATAQVDALKESLERVENERDEALKDLSVSVAAHRQATASLEAMQSPSSSARAMWEATNNTQKEKIESLEEELHILTRKLESETKNAERADDLLKEWKGKHDEVQAKLKVVVSELKLSEEKCSDLEIQVEELTQEVSGLEEKMEDERKKVLDRERQRRNEVLEVEPLNDEIARLGKDFEEARRKNDELEQIKFDNEKTIRALRREVDQIEQDLREAQHSNSSLEDVITEYQENVSKLTDELSMHRKLAITGEDIGSSDVFALKLTISQLEEEIARMRKELQSEDRIVECTELAQNESAVLSEIISRTLRKAAELLELCPVLRKQSKVRTGLETAKVAKMIEVLVRSLNRKMQVAEKYLTSFSGHLKQLRFVEDLHKDPVCMHLLSHHRTFWCNGAEAAYSVLVAACYHVNELLEPAMDPTADEVQSLIDQLTKARIDSDTLWDTTTTGTAADTPTPNLTPGNISALASPTTALTYDTPIRSASYSDTEELLSLKKQLSQFKAENKRLSEMIERRS